MGSHQRRQARKVVAVLALKCVLTCLQGLLTNSMESEPWFIGVVCMYCLVGVTNLQRIRFYAYAVNLMWGYVACRLVHAGAFLFAVRQPVRSFSWAGSVLCIAGMAVLALF